METASPQSREELILSCLKLARMFAIKFWKRGGCKADLDDLNGQAFLGVVLAAEKFDPKRGYTFGTLAGKYIYGQLLAYQSFLAGMSRSQHDHSGKEGDEISRPVFLTEVVTPEGVVSLPDVLEDHRINAEQELGTHRQMLLRLLDRPRITHEQKRSISLYLLTGNMRAAADKIGKSHQAIRSNINIAMPYLQRKAQYRRVTRLRRCPNNQPCPKTLHRLDSTSVWFVKSDLVWLRRAC
jgi:RNA polymerase sigma factor (sigma-70 family)